MVSMFQSVLQFQFVLATSARKMHFCTSRKALSIDFRDEGVHAKQNLGGIKNLQDYYHDRKIISFGALFFCWPKDAKNIQKLWIC